VFRRITFAEPVIRTKNTKLAFENKNVIRLKPNSCKYDTMHINSIPVLHEKVNLRQLRQSFKSIFDLVYTTSLETSKETNYFKVEGACPITQHECNILVIELEKLYKHKQRKFVRSGRGNLDPVLCQFVRSNIYYYCFPPFPWIFTNNTTDVFQ